MEEGEALLLAELMDVEIDAEQAGSEVDFDRVRAEMAESFERHAWQSDERRPDAVASRNAKGKRTARQNAADLMDAGSFLKYGPLAVAR